MKITAPASDNQDNWLLAGAVFRAGLQKHRDELEGLTIDEAMQLASFESWGFRVNVQPGKLSSAFGLTQPLRDTYFNIWCDIAQNKPERALEMIKNSGMSEQQFWDHFPNTLASTNGDKIEAMRTIGRTYKHANVHSPKYSGSFPLEVTQTLLYGRNHVVNQLYFFLENNRQNAETLRADQFAVDMNHLYTLHNLGPTDGIELIGAKHMALGVNQTAGAIDDSQIAAQELATLIEGLPKEHQALLKSKMDELDEALKEANQGGQIAMLGHPIVSELDMFLTGKVIKNNKVLTSGRTAINYSKSVDLNLTFQLATVRKARALQEQSEITPDDFLAAAEHVIYTAYKPLSAHLVRTAPISSIRPKQRPYNLAIVADQSELDTEQTRTDKPNDQMPADIAHRLVFVATYTKDGGHGIQLKLDDTSGVF